MTILASADPFPVPHLVTIGIVALARSVQLVQFVQIPLSRVLSPAQLELTLQLQEWELVSHALVATCAQEVPLSKPVVLASTVLPILRLAPIAPKATTAHLQLLIQCNAQQVSVLQRARRSAHRPLTGATQPRV